MSMISYCRAAHARTQRLKALSDEVVLVLCAAGLVVDSELWGARNESEGSPIEKIAVGILDCARTSAGAVPTAGISITLEALPYQVAAEVVALYPAQARLLVAYKEAEMTNLVVMHLGNNRTLDLPASMPALRFLCFQYRIAIMERVLASLRGNPDAARNSEQYHVSLSQSLQRTKV